VVVASHDRAQLDALCDRIVAIGGVSAAEAASPRAGERD